jgi:hypothetical protein
LDLPARVEDAPAAGQDRVQGVLVEGAQSVGMTADELDGPVLDPFRTPGPKVDDQPRFDSVWVTFAAAHQAGHIPWDPGQVPGLSGDDAAKPDGAIPELYERVDAALGRILARLVPGSDVMVLSPKGMGPNAARIDLLSQMLDRILGQGVGRGPSVARVERSQDRVGAGERASELPDLLAHWGQYPAQLIRGVHSSRFGEVLRAAAGTGRTGNHCPGTWVTLLPARARLADDIQHPARLEDVTATICTALGVPHGNLPGHPMLVGEKPRETPPGSASPACSAARRSRQAPGRPPAVPCPAA